MIQKIRKFIVTGIIGLTLMSPGLLVPMVATGVASADITSSLCTGVKDAANNDQGCENADGNGTSTVKTLAEKVTNIFSIIVGAASVIMIIYGGFRYITSGGDSGKVGNAKNTLIYAIVGLVIVALAQLIVRFTITQAANINSGV